MEYFHILKNLLQIKEYLRIKTGLNQSLAHVHHSGLIRARCIRFYLNSIVFWSIMQQSLNLQNCLKLNLSFQTYADKNVSKRNEPKVISCWEKNRTVKSWWDVLSCWELTRNCEAFFTQRRFLSDYSAILGELGELYEGRKANHINL